MTTLDARQSTSATIVSPVSGQLRRMLTGAGVFDASMGIVCLAAAGPLGRWLSLQPSTVRATGAVFLAAAAVGAQTLLRRRLDVRWIALANLVFAAWCLAVIGYDSPNGIGTALLAVSVVASAGTAIAEHLLARR